MSVSDYGLMFSLVLMLCILLHCIHISDYMIIQKLETQYNLAIDEAAEAALYDSVEYDSMRNIMINEREVIERFFQACYMNLGIMEKPDKKELCRFYVPYMLFVENDGIVPFIQQESKGEELIAFQNKRKIYYEWKGEQNDTLRVTLSDMVQYDNPLTKEHREGMYEDMKGQLPEWFQWEGDEYRNQKRQLIIGLVKECTNECINHQNLIAEKFGIEYQFNLPLIDYEEWYRTIEDISFLALFQGYPYGNGVTGTFNRVAVSGARIAKRDS